MGFHSIVRWASGFELGLRDGAAEAVRRRGIISPVTGLRSSFCFEGMVMRGWLGWMDVFADLFGNSGG